MFAETCEVRSYQKAEGEIERIHEVIMRELGEKHGIEYIPFPNDSTRQRDEFGGYKTRAGVTPEGVPEDIDDKLTDVQF